MNLPSFSLLFFSCIGKPTYKPRGNWTWWTQSAGFRPLGQKRWIRMENHRNQTGAPCMSWIKNLHSTPKATERLRRTLYRSVNGSYHSKCIVPLSYKVQILSNFISYKINKLILNAICQPKYWRLIMPHVLLFKNSTGLLGAFSAWIS